ncbi:MAG: DNA repair exonuclease, partial [Corynebacterium sp.]|nr:DNA repair exonuclease [Corynebacterium sp.]
FESNSLSPRVMGRIKEELSRISVPVYLLPGNHDPLVADSIFFNELSSESLPNIHVIADSQPIPVKDNIEIVGAPLRDKMASCDLVAAALAPLGRAEGIRIGVGHGQVQGWGDAEKLDTIDLAGVEEAINAGIIDYLALGDTHSTQSLGNSGAVWFSGSPETTDFKHLPGGGGESDSGNALVVTISKQIGSIQPSGSATARASRKTCTVDVTKHSLGEWIFESIAMDINSSTDVDSFIEQLEAYPDKRRTVVKYSLTGAISMEEHARLESALSALEPVFASLRPRLRLMDLHVTPAAEELRELGLSGFALATLDELIDDMDDNPTARDAANLLYRLAAEEK